MFLATCGGDIAVTSEIVAYSAGFFAVGVALAAVFFKPLSRDVTWYWLYAPLLLLHPAWMMTVQGTDCGLAKRFFSVAASLLLVAILWFQVFRPRSSQRRFILGVCLISWVGYAASSLLISLLETAQFEALFTMEVAITLASVRDWLPSIATALTLLCAILYLYHYAGVTSMRARGI